MEKEQLVSVAKDAMNLSYSPYSNFKVGAALLTKDGKTYKGANIENASYGMCMCAERNAMYHAYMNGVKKDDIVALAIIGNTDDPILPCGACLQVMSELLNLNTPIYLASTNGKIMVKTVHELFPNVFDSKDL